MTHRRALQGLVGQEVGGKAERSDVAGQVSDSQHAGEIPEVLEEPQPVGPLRQLPVLVERDAGADELLRTTRLVDGRDHAVAGAGQSPGAVDHLLQDGVEVEARIDALDGRAQRGDALLQRLDPSLQLVRILFLHRFTLVGPCASDPP